MEDLHVSLLKVRGLVKSYGRRRVVDGVDFEVDPGEIVGEIDELSPEPLALPENAA